eukprot:1402929-Amphidinium_carterae.1
MEGNWRSPDAGEGVADDPVPNILQPGIRASIIWARLWRPRSKLSATKRRIEQSGSGRTSCQQRQFQASTAESEAGKGNFKPHNMRIWMQRGCPTAHRKRSEKVQGLVQGSLGSRMAGVIFGYFYFFLEVDFLIQT